ncbi:hypothetical protein MP228_008679 [Amoeboaphelidium protococcarum]|nr:hypothetical protein MP228_008679 [Amoeboaphelidium protococcarum]
MEENHDTVTDSSQALNDAKTSNNNPMTGKKLQPSLSDMEVVKDEVHDNFDVDAAQPITPSKNKRMSQNYQNASESKSRGSFQRLSSNSQATTEIKITIDEPQQSRQNSGLAEYIKAFPTELRRLSRIQQVFEVSSNQVTVAGTVVSSQPSKSTAQVEVISPVFSDSSARPLNGQNYDKDPSQLVILKSKIIHLDSDKLQNDGGNNDYSYNSGRSVSNRRGLLQRVGRLVSQSVRSAVSTSTFKAFWKVLLLSGLVLLPGLILHFAFAEPVKFGNLEALVCFSIIAVLLWIYPVTKLFLHVLFYHLISESSYDDYLYGDALSMGAEVMPHLAGTITMLLCFLSWNVIFPLVYPPSVVDQTAIPFNYINPVFGVITLWLVSLSLKNVGTKRLVYKFNQSTFQDRVRESIFMDFIVETLREAKRRLKYLRKIQAQDEVNRLYRTGGSNASSHGSSTQYRMPISPEILFRVSNLVIPYSFKDLLVDEPNQQELSKQLVAQDLTFHGWKRLLDMFYSVALTDDFVREEVEAEGLRNDDMELLDLIRKLHDSNDKIDFHTSKKLAGLGGVHESTSMLHRATKYHHLHHFHYQRQQKRKAKRQWYFTANDEKASHLADKFFQQLRHDQDQDYLDVNKDLMPLFSWGNVQDTLAADNVDLSSMEREIIQKQQSVQQIVRLFLLSKSDKGKFTQRDFRQLLIKIYRERGRLVASLSGMKSLIRKVDDFLTIVLCFLLVMGTLSIFGVNAYSVFVSISSVMVSFAFLFGSTAKQAFEGIILMFLVHPYDVGDRIWVSGQNYVVTRVNILSTVVERWDGQLIYLPNSKLALLDISNIRRAKPQYEQYALRVTYTTPLEKLQELQKKLQAFVKSESTHFQEGVSFSIDNFTDMEGMVVKLTYAHRTNYQNFDLYNFRRIKFCKAAVAAMKELDITFTPLSKPFMLDMSSSIDQQTLQKSE